MRREFISVIWSNLSTTVENMMDNEFGETGETHQMEEALKTVLESVDLDETLVIVTADHSHSVTMNGYPEVRCRTQLYRYEIKY